MRILRKAIWGAAALFVVLVAAGYGALRGSLPQLDGEVVAPLTAPVAIERDALGVPTITADNRVDLAYAVGFAHGQDRFFQMDLLRRAAAGELSALLGKDLLATDKRFRRHNFRNVARQVLANATPEQQQLAAAYVAGANAGLASLTVRPFEYLLLNVRPEAWRAEDCLLVAYAMYIDLHDAGAGELERARLRSALPEQVYAVLYPRGTEWDAPLDEADVSTLTAPLPGPEALDLRKAPPRAPSVASEAMTEFPGSNNWALAGARTQSGAGLVANDMHLSFRLPHVWYRARMIVRAQDPAVARELVGVTLPGSPFLIAGSNGRVAWGFTNSQGDYTDLVALEEDQTGARYRVGDRSMEYGVRRERFAVRGGDAVEVEYRDTIWGPVLDDKVDGKSMALAWTAQHAEASNLNLLALESVGSVEEALAVANTVGIPPQNFMTADAQGHIGWTIIGKLPKRVGVDGRLPACWGCAANIGWQGWIAPQDYPRVLDPASGQLWSANSRTLGAPQLGYGVDLIGDENMDRGARAKQIRDDLSALKQATPQDMLNVQLDDRAVFLKRWRDLLVNLQDETYLRGHAARRTALKLVEGWSGRASVDDAGYRIVRTVRLAVQQDIFDDLIAPARAKFPDAVFKPTGRFEDTVWRIMTTDQPHLLNPSYENSTARVLAALDRAIEQLQKDCDVTERRLQECTWGRRNTLKMAHPLAAALPLFGRWLRLPSTPLPGDNDMPRVQSVSFGASERFAVSPGHEDQGYFHMPGGQSGHPLSPFFSAGHEAWAKGEPTTFLPGAARHRLQLNRSPADR